MHYFTPPGSIARRIWGNGDTLLLVFAGAAAEFALDKTVDWLFFTGKLPRDPIGRLFSTARFAQEIMFADAATAQRTIDRIGKIHASVERQRGEAIPDWAYRDVLYMLMDYSERAYTLLHRPLTIAERDELYDVNRRFGVAMGIPAIPESYAAWQIDRQQHLRANLAYSDYTAMLFAQYRRHLGPWRYNLLLQTQALLAPSIVRELLKLPTPATPIPVHRTYDLVLRLRLRPLLQRMFVQPQYLQQIRQLDYRAAA
jgi:uncharacterized protein (DUF2236 family)